MQKSPYPDKEYSIFDDESEITRRFTLGVREVARDHALAGRSIPIWRDGKVAFLSPEEVLKVVPPCADATEATRL